MFNKINNFYKCLFLFCHVCVKAESIKHLAYKLAAGYNLFIKQSDDLLFSIQAY